MAISSADIGASFDSNRADASIGGYMGDSYKISTEPFDRLAQYTYLYEDKKHTEDEKAKQDKLKQFADVSTIDWQNAIPSERDAALKNYQDFVAYAKTMASKDFSDPNVQLDWQTHVTEAKKTGASINARFTSYGKRLQDIADATTTAQKEFLQQQLDNDVKSTTVQDALPLQQKYNIVPAPIPTPVVKNVKIEQVSPNYINGIDNQNIPDDAANNALAFATVNGLQTQYAKAGEKEKAAGGAYDVYEVLESAPKLTEAINAYRNPATGEIDETQLASKNSVVWDVVQQVKTYNAKRAEIRAAITRGDYGDQLKASDYPDIVWQDGIAPDELIKLRMNAKLPIATYKEDTRYTGAGETARKNKADEAETIRFHNMTNALNLTNSDIEALKGGLKKNDKTGQWEKTETTDSGGVVSYWQNHLIPQIYKVAKYLNTKGETIDFPANYSGEVAVAPNKISGLGVALVGELDDKGHQLGTTSIDRAAIVYKNGEPIGVKLAPTSGKWIYVDAEDINSKATQLQNKAISNKQDSPIFEGTGSTTTSSSSGSTTSSSESGSAAQKASAKTVPLSTLQGLVGSKGYEGYTLDEIKAYYKSNGYTIK